MKLKDRFENTPLMLAAKNGHTETVQVLVENGANIEAHDGSFTALRVATDLGYAEIVKLLIDCGANIEAQDNDLLDSLNMGC